MPAPVGRLDRDDNMGVLIWAVALGLDFNGNSNGLQILSSLTT